jgi:hypothetical protein
VPAVEGADLGQRPLVEHATVGQEQDGARRASPGVLRVARLVDETRPSTPLPLGLILIPATNISMTLRLRVRSLVASISSTSAPSFRSIVAASVYCVSNARVRSSWARMASSIDLS